MKVLLAYARGNAEILNRKSALGSYMHCLCSLLQQEGFEIFFNNLKFSELDTPAKMTNSSGKSGRAWGKIIPRFAKNFLKNKIRFRQIEALKSELNSITPDLILEFYNYGSDMGYSLSVDHQIPIIVVYDAPVLEEYEFFNGRSFFFRRRVEKRERFTLERAERIIVYSCAVKEYLINKYSLPDHKFFIHQNVDFTRFDFNTPKPFTSDMNIGFIGSFLTWHRVDMLISVFDNLVKEGIQANLFLIGSGLEYERIKHDVQGLHSASKITMTGFLDGQELSSLKSKLHIGVMPGSNWYGAPNKIFEYGAAGMAVVAPDTPTIKNLFEPDEVAFFKWNDLNSLQDTLRKVLSERSIYNELSQKLSTKIRHDYSEKLTIDFYKNLIETVTGKEAV